MENKINKLYKCNLCNKNYSSYQSLWNHNNNIINKNKLKCKNCNKIYLYQNNFIIHEKKCEHKMRVNMIKIIIEQQKIISILKNI